MKRIFLVAVALYMAELIGISQEAEINLFDTSILHEIRVSFDEENFWQILIDNYNSANHHKSPGDFLPDTLKHFSQSELLKLLYYSKSDKDDDDDVPYLEGEVSIDGYPLGSSGIKLKGYSSFFGTPGVKKSMKIDLNVYNDTNSFFGVKKLVLHHGMGDPSFQPEAVCYSILRKAGIAAPHTSFARLYLNDTYWGLYVLVEQIDKKFLKEYFPDGSGNLYKAAGWTELEYISDNFDDYSETIELKTNEGTADGSDYIKFVKSINRLIDKAFNDSIQKLFYLDYFFKVLAADVITKNWDSYYQNGRNFYLYHEPSSDLFYWIPWDYNFALDGQMNNVWPQEDTCTSNIAFSFDSVEYSGPGVKMKYRFMTNERDFQFLWLSFGDYRDTIFDVNSYTGNPDTVIIDGYHIYEQKGIYPITVNMYSAQGCFYYLEDKAIMMDTTGLCPSVLEMLNVFIEGDTTYDLTFDMDSYCCDCQWDNVCQKLKEKIDYHSQTDDGSFPIDLSGSSKVFLGKLMSNPEFRNRYLDMFRFVLDSAFVTGDLQQQILSGAALIRDAVYADTNLLFSVNAFETDINSLCEHDNSVTSISRLIERRKEGLLDEYDFLNYSPQPVKLPVSRNDVVINEFAATLRDHEGSSTDDWIELYNNTENELEIEIPCGLVFISAEEDTSRMMVVQPSLINMSKGKTDIIKPFVLSIDALKALPAPEKTYRVEELEGGKQLQFAECLCKKDLPAETETQELISLQLAAWMVDSEGVFTTLPDNLNNLLKDITGLPISIPGLDETMQDLAGSLAPNAQGWLDRCGIELGE